MPMLHPTANAMPTTRLRTMSPTRGEPALP
ncbi:MAG: hypothetical protein Ct9H300mP31_07610 [Acidimicrobiaceae bacterium]|nr:MAG: hypothetical protein Ct9H300mP31_07610 [Acidimicrobiaceae bacterium]